jgi:hypothetical protein
MVGQESLQSYYLINFNLSLHYKYSLDELENMIPWERTIYLMLIENHIKEKNEEYQRQMQQSGFQHRKIEYPE